tara:strand:- start:283 stop:411 length:129 start_codon:yes stop_codon:yes gene_type:complete
VALGDQFQAAGQLFDEFTSNNEEAIATETYARATWRMFNRIR